MALGVPFLSDELLGRMDSLLKDSGKILREKTCLCFCF